MDVVRPRRARLARERAEHPLVAGERAGVGCGRGRADRRRPDLQHRHADAGVGARGERLAQGRTVARVLDEQGDRPQLRLGRELGEPVRGADDRLVPGRDRGVEPEPAAGRERVDDEVAALRDQPDMPRLDRLQRIPPEGGAGVERDEPVAVRAADRQGVPEGRGAQLGLERGPGGRGERGHRGGGGRDRCRDAGALAEAGGEDDGASAAERAGLVDQAGDRRRRGGDDDRVGRRREVGERGDARKAVGGLAVRVDAPDLAAEARGPEVDERLAPVLVAVVGGAHDRNGAWVEQAREVHVSGSCARRPAARARGR
jgi:hypothetical protein